MSSIVFSGRSTAVVCSPSQYSDRPQLPLSYQHLTVDAMEEMPYAVLHHLASLVVPRIAASVSEMTSGNQGMCDDDKLLGKHI